MVHVRPLTRSQQLAVLPEECWLNSSHTPKVDLQMPESARRPRRIPDADSDCGQARTLRQPAQPPQLGLTSENTEAGPAIQIGRCSAGKGWDRSTVRVQVWSTWRIKASPRAPQADVIGSLDRRQCLGRKLSLGILGHACARTVAQLCKATQRRGLDRCIEAQAKP